MGYLKDIGKGFEKNLKNLFKKDTISSITDSFKSSVKNGFITGFINGVNARNRATLTQNVPETNFFDDDLIALSQYDKMGYSGFTNEYTSNEKAQASSLNSSNDLSKFLKVSKKVKSKNISDADLIYSQRWRQTLSLPEWDYSTFINERAIWQKGLSNPFGDPGYFYFKIFFKFDTQFGLFGGILNNEKPYTSHNSASKYLTYLATKDSSGKGRYTSVMPEDRIKALTKFVKSLSYINCNAPWFFKNIRGLDKAGIPISEQDYSKEKIIEIGCDSDAIDMRLTTLLDLYNFACYDIYNHKEIIPENLRKFDMLVMIFGAPIKTLHTAIKHNEKTYKYKQTSVVSESDYGNLASFKIYEFNGCEIDSASLSSMVPGDLNNEAPFNLGKGTIRIRYDKCMQHLSNEFSHILFGTTGFYWSYDNMNKATAASHDQTRISAYIDKYDKLSSPDVTNPSNKAPNPATDKYVDIAESMTKNNLVKVSGFALGNLYHENNIITGPEQKIKDGKVGPGKTSEYFNAKLKYLHNRKNTLKNDALMYILKKWFGYSNRNQSQLGSIWGENGNIAVGSEYWKYKVDKLRSQFSHDWTTAPHSHGYHDNKYSQVMLNAKYSKNYEVNEIERLMSLGQIDQGNEQNSKKNQNNLAIAIQELRARAARGQFVGPRTGIYSMKVSAMKMGSHASTVAPHSHTGSTEKYVNDLKTNTVYGKDEYLYDVQQHIFTTKPYSKNGQANPQLDSNETQPHSFTVEPHKPFTDISKQDILDDTIHRFTVEPYAPNGSTIKKDTSEDQRHDFTQEPYKPTGKQTFAEDQDHSFTQVPHTSTNDKNILSDQQYVFTQKSYNTKYDLRKISSKLNFHRFTDKPRHPNYPSVVQESDKPVSTHNFVGHPHNSTNTRKTLEDREHNFTQKPYNSSDGSHNEHDLTHNKAVYDFDENLSNVQQHVFTQSPYIEQKSNNQNSSEDQEHNFTQEPYVPNGSTIKKDTSEDQVNNFVQEPYVPSGSTIKKDSSEDQVNNFVQEPYVPSGSTIKKDTSEDQEHIFTTEPHTHEGSTEKYISDLKTHKVYDQNEYLYDVQQHVYTQAPYISNGTVVRKDYIEDDGKYDITNEPRRAKYKDQLTEKEEDVQ